MPYTPICAFGDSITNGYWDEEGKGGWFGRLAQLIAPAYPYQFGFNNLAMDGDRSFDVMHRLQSEGLARDTGIIIIAVGINDLIRWHQPDGPLDMSEPLRDEVWDKILATAKRLAPKVLVQSILPIDESRFPQEGAGGRKLYHRNADVAVYNKLIAAKCIQRDIMFADYTDRLGKDWHTQMYDASHPNAQGHQKVAELTFAEFKSLGWL